MDVGPHRHGAVGRGARPAAARAAGWRDRVPEGVDGVLDTPGSLYYIIRGSGYSTIDQYRVDWEAGDTFSCPSYSWHEHWNTGDEVVLMWTVQDLPSYSYNRMVAFQSGDSDELSLLHDLKT